MTPNLKFDAEALKRLSEATTPQDFLRLALESRQQQGGKALSYSALSKKAGFSSRNFSRDVILGKKRLTLESAKKFARALALDANLGKLLFLLVEREAAEEPKEFAELERRRASLAKRLAGRAGAAAGGKIVYAIEHATKVYSALGTQESGANLEEILRRTGLPAKTAEEALGRLRKEGFVVGRDGRFFACDAHLFFDSMGGDSAFKSLFLRSLLAIQRRGQNSFGDKKLLFFQSNFSLSESRMEEFSEQLNQLLLEFVDTAENPQGDKVATLACGFIT